MEMYMITCRLMYEGTYFASNIYFSYKIGAFNIGIKQVVIPTALLWVVITLTEAEQKYFVFISEVGNGTSTYIRYYEGSRFQ